MGAPEVLSETAKTGEFKGLKLTNTLTRQKEDFRAIDDANVRMYVCGPTVYDFAHIGNARPVIVFDVLYRLLRHLYGAEHVTYVRNITDVDDKINARALRDHPDLPLNEAIANVTKRTADQFHEDVQALGCLKPDHEPRATAHVPGMVEMIGTLIDRGHAYEANGEVLFDTASMPGYGGLSKRKLDEQMAGARVAVDAHKKNPGDFVLWKLSSAEEPGWDSPWGRGRPGWHIECSVMSAHHLGKVFDIHGGGLDLIFPHHENEIAQSCCAHGTQTMANYWLHNGFVQVEGKKMSKSEGNFFTIHDLLYTETFGSNRWHGYVLRLAMLMTNYREPINWTVDRLVEVRTVLKDWIDVSIGSDKFVREEGQLRILDALYDDLNTTKAIAVLHQLANQARSGCVETAAELNASMRFLGIWNGEPSADIYSYGYVVQAFDEKFVSSKIAERLEYLKAKNFAEADRIRDELTAEGIQLKDGKDPETGERITTWEVKR
ncbi:cysteinyl-tRNA synthetase [Roseibium hamelinense]|uniref:Cysteine--tRNA ligase n=1 Tax=Roseibium hamelinense TaxID=150831 RepID=A0A562T9I5_9HYPH|nr:cysteine--tRNA ligase [Roseibium hamelinense]MTI43530.1 cysteine--tRNA ligase [Roseibium hamelinense]TWI89676.1 cysteinyl-tRNA synthetase [Roseibium hamelinense]